MDRIVLAYSGGVGAEAALAGLRARDRTEIITVTLDVGQGRELESVRDRALASGAVRAHVLDVREEFARDYVLPALRAGALGSASGSMLRAIVRPLVARSLTDVAKIEHASSVAYGHTGVDRPSRYHLEQSLWGRHVRYSPGAGAPHNAFVLTRPETESPNESAVVEISFERGVPVAINSVPMPLLELIGALSAIAGIYGVGRTGPVERRGPGATWFEVSELPAVAVLQTAFGALHAAIPSPDLESFPGIVRIRLSKGRCDIDGVRGARSGLSIAMAPTENLSQTVLVTT